MKYEPGPRGTTLRDFCATSMGAPEGRAKKVTATQSRARQSKAQQSNAKQRKRKAKQCKGNAKQSKAKQNKAVGKEKSHHHRHHRRSTHGVAVLHQCFVGCNEAETAKRSVAKPPVRTSVSSRTDKRSVAKPPVSEGTAEPDTSRSALLVRRPPARAGCIAGAGAPGSLHSGGPPGGSQTKGALQNLL